MFNQLLHQSSHYDKHSDKPLLSLWIPDMNWIELLEILANLMHCYVSISILDIKGAGQWGDLNLFYLWETFMLRVDCQGRNFPMEQRLWPWPRDAGSRAVWLQVHPRLDDTPISLIGRLCGSQHVSFQYSTCSFVGFEMIGKCTLRPHSFTDFTH